MISEVPSDLVERIASGNAAVFVGAGLSFGAGLPDWAQLLKEMLAHLEKGEGTQPDRTVLLAAIDSGDLLDAAEELRERLRGDEFRRFLRDRIQGTQPRPTQVHRLLQQIPFGVQVTTNYDGLLEGAYALEHDGATLHTFTHHDVPELGAATRSGDYLLKLHGDINRIETVVLGKADYRRIMQANPACRTHLTTLFATRTVLFLGYGLGDPDLMLVLDALSEHFRGYTGTHYALMPEDRAPAFKRNRLAKDQRIRVLTYEPTPGHPEVQQFLESLATEVSRARRAAVATPVRIAPVERLAQEVTEWLSAIGYRVEQESARPEATAGAGRLYLTASLNQGSIAQRVRVHCIGGEISASDIEALDASLDRRTNQGWAICDQRVSPQATARAAELDGVEAYRLADFLTAKVWGPYIEALNELVLGPQIPERYVDPACHKKVASSSGQEGPAEDMGGLDAYMDGWLTERGKVHMSLLGEFGTGKTWFCRHYAWRRLQRYLADPAGERLPLLVTLRDFVKTTNPEQLINDLLLERYKLPFVGSAFAVFKEMNRRGKLLLILDGFDEMARKADYQTVVDNFWELARLVEDESKVILTSRTEYFRWAKESEKVLSGQEYGRKTIALEPPRFEVLYLTPFDDERIRRMIVARLGEDQGNAIAAKVLARDNLKEMARKPVLTELLLAAIDEAGIDALDNEADIYLNATNRLLVRNIDTQRTFTSTTDKLYFLCELAWEMIRDGELRIHYKEIPERIRRLFGVRIENEQELDHWDYDLRNQTLLHRNAAGYYEFAHKSLAEFFVALKFAAELGQLDPRVCANFRNMDGSEVALPYGVLELEGLADTFGAMPLGGEQLMAVRDFLMGLLSLMARDHLDTLMLKTRGSNFDAVKYSGGNAAVLFSHFCRIWRGADLSRQVLAGARFYGKRVELYGQDLTGVDFSAADLRGSNFQFAILEGTRLVGANLSEMNGLEQPIAPRSVCWTANGSRVIVGGSDGCVRVWNTLEFRSDAIINLGCRGWVTSIKSLPDSRSFLFADRGELTIHWDLDAQREIRRFINPHSGAHEIAISPDGSELLCADEDACAVLYDIENGSRLAEFRSHEQDSFAYVCCNAGTRGGWFTGHDGGLIRFWSQSGDNVFSFQSPFERVNGLVAVEAEGLLIASGSPGASGVRLIALSLEAKEIVWTRFDNEAGSGMVVFSPARNCIAISQPYSRHHGALIVDVKTGSEKYVTGSGDCFATELAFSPDGRLLAIGANDGSVRVSVVDTGDAKLANCVSILDMKLNAYGANISEALGLDEALTWHRQGGAVQGTRLEFFADCGAILDEDQRRRLAEWQAKKPS